MIARQDAGWMVVQVSDQGIGIPARDRERLFERFFRGSNATGIAARTDVSSRGIISVQGIE